MTLPLLETLIAEMEDAKTGCISLENIGIDKAIAIVRQHFAEHHQQAAPGNGGLLEKLGAATDIVFDIKVGGQWLNVDYEELIAEVRSQHLKSEPINQNRRWGESQVFFDKRVPDDLALRATRGEFTPTEAAVVMRYLHPDVRVQFYAGAGEAFEAPGADEFNNYHIDEGELYWLWCMALDAATAHILSLLDKMVNVETVSNMQQAWINKMPAGLDLQPVISYEAMLAALNEALAAFRKEIGG